MLLRFWDVDSGKITLGDADIRHMEQDQLMKYCSVVFQDNFLFSCSIAENIAYGIENVTEEAIINAAKQARIQRLYYDLAGAISNESGGTRTIIVRRTKTTYQYRPAPFYKIARFYC